jgi:hypothetical protein
MEECLYYHVHTRQLENDEVHSHQQSIEGVTQRIPWCSHKFSPAKKTHVTSVYGGAGLLQCGGNLEKCQVPKEKFLDI